MPAVGEPSSGSCSAAFGLVLSQSDQRSCWQYQQSPQQMKDGTTTRSPLRTLRTSRPTSTTSPMNSWPITSPARMEGR